jgi:hypothetical protein
LPPEVSCRDAANRHAQLALSASHHGNTVKDTDPALSTIFFDFFGVIFLLYIGLLPNICLLKEHFHEFCLLIHKLAIVLVDENRLHNEFIKATEAILA